VACTWEKRNTCTVLAGKCERKRPLRRLRRRYEDNIKMFVYLFVFGARAPSGPGPSHSRGF
jgi:hypothetical protein